MIIALLFGHDKAPRLPVINQPLCVVAYGSSSHQAWISPIMQYKSNAYSNTYISLGYFGMFSDKLQHVLNAAARVISGTRKFDHGLRQLPHDELHWLDVSDRVFFKLAVTVHQCRNGRAPSYLSDHCTPLSAGTRRHLGSTNCNLLAVPRHRLNTYGGRAFAVTGLTVWNSLPDFIRDPSISTDSFRRLLKTYLFARY